MLITAWNCCIEIYRHFVKSRMPTVIPNQIGFEIFRYQCHQEYQYEMTEPLVKVEISKTSLF